MSVHKIVRELSALFQRSEASFKRHNRQYEEPGKLAHDKALAEQNIASNTIDGDEHKTLSLLKQHPAVTTVVDIGSGVGWVSAVLSPHVRNVIAMEPSAAAVKIAQEIFPQNEYPNITWQVGFGEQLLQELNLTAPTLFVTGCVLNHLRDAETIKICELVNEKAPIGSIFSFVENWGDEEWHQLLWHVRTKAWWQTQFPGWELDFHGPEVPEKDTYKGRYHKGIHGVKVQ